MEEVEQLFQTSVTPVQTFKPPRDFSFYFLYIFALVNVVYMAYLCLGLLGGARGLRYLGLFFLNPPETANTFAKMTLMVSVALVGAFNADRRRAAAVLLVIGHAIAVGTQLWLYLAYAPNPLLPDERPYLLTGIISDGVIILLLLYVLVTSRRYVAEENRVEDIELRSPASTIFCGALLGIGLLYTACAIAVVCLRLFVPPTSVLGAVFGGPDPLVSNSVTKYGALALFCIVLRARPTWRTPFMPPLFIALSVGVLAIALYAILGRTTIVTRPGTPVTMTWFPLVQMLIDGGTLALLIGLRRAQYLVDYNITSLSPSAAECVMALHQALRELSQEPALTSRLVLQRLDEHIATIRSRRRGLLAFPFWLVEHVFPLLCGLRPPFSTLSRAEQRWMLRRYMLRPHYERARALLPPVADFLYQIGDVVHALLAIAYFTTPQAQAQVGYVLPDARARLQGDIATLRPPNQATPPALPQDFQDPHGKKPLADPVAAATLLTPRLALAYDFTALPDEVDYCIIGSGAAGGVLAYRLGVAQGQGNTICVLERGGYYSPRQDFTDDELRMIRLLYTEGGLQMSRSFDFTILQGECVGGTTVINNAICLEMPATARREWERFGIDVDALQPHYAQVRGEINIGELRPEAVNARVEDAFTRGVAGYNAAPNGMGPLSPAHRLAGNFSNCLGCGLCNIGCQRMRKLSVLETYLPWAQAHGVMVYSNVGAVQCETQAHGGTSRRVTAVIVRTQNGTFQRLRIRKALIIAAGAIASSRFLLRSNVGGPGVGRGLSCNYALPTLVTFDDTLDAFDGVQITTFAAPDSYEAVFETTYNPPGAYSIALPLYFERHAEMMRAYRQAVNFGALVGSHPSGVVSRTRDVLFGRAITWEQTTDDLRRIKQALVTLVRIAQAAGGARILLPTHPTLDLSLRTNLDQTLATFARVLDDRRYVNFVTAHPQGGNMLAEATHAERVVEYPDFRVRDCANLFVCDASVFPRGIRVNPQWTIMALASLAAERIAQST